MNRVNRHFPPHIKKSKSFNELANVETIELDKLDLQIEDLNKQIIIETATWGLDIWERELGLPINPDKTLAERRSIILAKLRGIGKVDNIMIKAIVEAYTKKKVKVGFDGSITINFKNQTGYELSHGLHDAIDNIKPAHLPFMYLAGIVKHLIVYIRNYYFPVKYKICNKFVTADTSGVIVRNDIPLNVRKRIIDVNYPICGEFRTARVYGGKASNEFNKMAFNRE